MSCSVWDLVVAQLPYIFLYTFLRCFSLINDGFVHKARTRSLRLQTSPTGEHDSFCTHVITLQDHWRSTLILSLRITFCTRSWLSRSHALETCILRPSLRRTFPYRNNRMKCELCFEINSWWLPRLGICYYIDWPVWEVVPRLPTLNATMQLQKFCVNELRRCGSL